MSKYLSSTEFVQVTRSNDLDFFLRVHYSEFKNLYFELVYASLSWKEKLLTYPFRSYLKK